MNLSELYTGCRSNRRFQQKEIPQDVIKEMVENARTRSCAMNEQVLRYIVVRDADIVSRIQPCLHWAARLPKEVGTPKADETPTAFILVLVPEKAGDNVSIDVGIALDTMAITAWNHGVGSCILGAVERDKVQQIVKVPEGYSIRVVLALGYPLGTSTIVDAELEHGLGYYVDQDRNYYVPKRSVSEICEWI